LGGGGHGSTILIELTKEQAATLNKSGQVDLNHAPDQMIADLDVLVRELVSESDDLGHIFNQGEQVTVLLGQSSERFADDELPCNRSANQAALLMVVKAVIFDGLKDGIAGIDHIVEKGLWITPHVTAS
jgi:hypothetical protein